MKSKSTLEKYDKASKNYDRFELPAEKLLFSRIRKKAFRSIHGKILEIGIGTGKNMPYYPAGAEVTGIDFSAGMLGKAEILLSKLNLQNVKLVKMDAQELKFADNSFDFVISSFVFCTVPDPMKGLSDAYRVLKPGGTAIFIEHMKSRSFLLNIILNLMNLMTVPMTGTYMNRETQKNIENAGFRIESVENRLFDIVRHIKARK
jgi:ubiquinone/menaquinone biosynthesis C-methylase UbiE